jgi:hypothetical protein
MEGTRSTLDSTALIGWRNIQSTNQRLVVKADSCTIPGEKESKESTRMRNKQRERKAIVYIDSQLCLEVIDIRRQKDKCNDKNANEDGGSLVGLGP